MATGGWGGKKGIGYKGTRGIILGGGTWLTYQLYPSVRMHRCTELNTNKDWILLYVKYHLIKVTSQVFCGQYIWPCELSSKESGKGNEKLR